MNLASIINEIETLKPAAAMDITAGPAETSVGRMGIKRHALERTKQLKSDYQLHLKNSSVFIVAVGSTRNTFCEAVAGEKYGAFTVDADDLYKSLVAKLNPAIFGKERTGFIFNALANHLYDRAMELGIGSYNHLQYNNKYSAYVTSPEELLPIIRAAINEQVGSEIVGLHSLALIADKAIAQKHTAEVTPVLLNVSDDAFALDLYQNLKRLTSKVFLVASGKTSREITTTPGAVLVKSVSEESVEKALDSIRNKI